MSRTLLALAGVAVAIALPSLAHAQGQAQLMTPPSGPPQTRTLICHGGPALQVRVHADPSPSWIGPASYPTKPVRMALKFAGGASFTDADNLPAGSCAWKDWNSALGVPPGEVLVDVNHPSRPAPTPTSIRADLADAKRFYYFRVSLMSEPLASFSGEWIPGASSQAAAPSTPATAAGPDPILRQLMCRGGPSGFEFKVIADPSPAYSDPPRRVRFAIHYRVHAASDTSELELGSMSPGSCGWDMRFGSAVPPGHVIIDIETDAQASNATFGIPRDTSVRAGLVYQDTTTLKRYLSEPGHFWIFYHMDRGEPLALSHGAHKADLTNLFGGRVENARTTASGTGTRTGTTQGSTGSAAGALRDASPGSATLSSARVLSSDSAARTAIVVHTPAPAPAPTATGTGTGTVGGTLRDKSPATATVAGPRPLPTDSAARRTATVRTPTPAAAAGSGVDGPLRDNAATTGSVSSALPTDSAARRTATVRTPTPAPTGGVVGPLRDKSPAAAPSTSRVMPTDTGPKVPDDARAKTPQLRVNRVYDVRTAPGPLGVKLTFNATGAGATGEVLGLTVYNPTGGIAVQFSRTPPTWDARERLWSYGTNGPWSAEVKLAEGAGFVAEPLVKLGNGERYYYLITVYGRDASAPPGQRTGSFTADVRTPTGDLFR